MNGDSLPVAEVRIPSDPSGIYGHAGEALVETSDGEKSARELANTSGEQVMPVNEKKYARIKIAFKSVYPAKEYALGV